MSATTPAKRIPSHTPSGGDHIRKPYVMLAIGGWLFLIAWLIWTLWFSSALPA